MPSLVSLRSFFHRLTHWEYWPEEVVMSIPLCYWMYLSVRARAVFFVSAANPGIRNGGMAMESKKEIYDILPPAYTPATLYFAAGTEPNSVTRGMLSKGINYPLIAKPDIGLKGKAVAKVNNESELADYIRRANFDFLIQELIPYDNEVGIFYYRHPEQERGTISGIVHKEFMTLVGDGHSTIRELLLLKPRYMLQIAALEQQYGAGLDRVPQMGEILDLVPYGNHARGAKFTDASHLITDRLTDTIDALCRQIPGFYYGRLDVRYSSMESMEQGDGFSIIELNGAGADPTHIFDPRHSIFWAWAEIMRHWRVMYEISIANHRRGAVYLSLGEGLRVMRDSMAHSKVLDLF